MRGAVSALFHTTYDMVIGEVQKRLFHVIGKKLCMRRPVSICRQQAAVTHRSEYCPRYRCRCGNEMLFTCFTCKIDE